MTLEQAAWLVLGLDAVMILYTLAIFMAGGLPGRTAAIIGGVGIGWLVALRGLFSRGAPFPEDISGSGFFAVILVAVVLVGALMFVPRTLRASIVGMNQTWLLAPQGIRVFFGATFLLWAGEGLLPRGFGISDGFTHISAGFIGLAAAAAAARSMNARSLLWIANLFGLADILIVATSIAYVLLPDIGPHHPMMYAVFAPAPVWLWLHIVSLYRLATDPRPSMGDVARHDGQAVAASI